MKGYKFLKSGYKSEYGDFTYEIGKTYKHEGEIKLCESGFHFSRKIRDAIQYVSGDHCIEVEATGDIIEDDNKCVCSEITVIKELNITEVLEMLSKDKDWAVRHAVAWNSNTSIEILKILSEDENWYIRHAVTKNQNTSIETLEMLSKDEDRDVRRATEENINKRK